MQGVYLHVCALHLNTLRQLHYAGVYLHVCALHLNTLRQLHYAGGILTCMCLASKYPETVALCRGYTYMYVPCI